ncbi:unnamed protein product [Effrenium voratum]|nr:unnamed protein product [Effrenium voratum]
MSWRRARGSLGGYGLPEGDEAEPQVRRRWRVKEEIPQPVANVASRVVWFLGRRCVELLLPSGQVRSSSLAVSVKPGSRAAMDAEGRVFVLENGSSAVWQVTGALELLSQGVEASRFRSSLGSRFVQCGDQLLVTGTPGPGAHTPWLFDLQSRTWQRLPDAPHAILSSAVVCSDEVTIIGGWSKMRSCHGFTQRLNLRAGGWQVLGDQVPWRRPGAACSWGAGALLALGWMECEGRVGADGFRLLRRNGAAQRAQSSSSRLVALQPSASGAGGLRVQEVAELPHADSFESLGQIFPSKLGVVCLGRDHVQIFGVTGRTWQSWPLPQELARDESNSWVKHCGSWAEQKKVEELMQNWESRFAEQAKVVKVAVDKALELDREYTSIDERVQAVKEERHQVLRKKDAAENSMQLIHEQQELLSNLLGHLENELDLGSTAKKSRSAVRLEERVMGLGQQLDELTRQARTLADQINHQGSCDPVAQMAHLLEAHQSNLDAVQERLDATEKKLRMVEAEAVETSNGGLRLGRRAPEKHPAEKGAAQRQREGTRAFVLKIEQSMALRPSYKVVLVGDTGTGKSSLVLRFARWTFHPDLLPTLALDYQVLKVHVSDETTKLKLWDTAGQERFRSLIPAYLAGADVAVVVYDITKPESFSASRHWVEEIQKELGPDGALLALVGNKADLEASRAVATEEARRQSEALGAIFLETSAKTGENVKELFQKIGELLPARPRPQKLQAIAACEEDEPRKKCCFCRWS